jgi:hypothetical protein
MDSFFHGRGARRYKDKWPGRPKFPTVLGWGFWEGTKQVLWVSFKKKKYNFEEVIHYEVRIHIHVYHVLCTENYNTGTNKNGSWEVAAKGRVEPINPLLVFSTELFQALVLCFLLPFSALCKFKLVDFVWVMHISIRPYLQCYCSKLKILKECSCRLDLDRLSVPRWGPYVTYVASAVFAHQPSRNHQVQIQSIRKVSIETEDYWYWSWKLLDILLDVLGAKTVGNPLVPFCIVVVYWKQWG